MKYFFLVVTLVATISITYAQTSEAQQIIVDLNPQQFNTDFSEYDQATSLYCARLSDIVYLDSTSINLLVLALQSAYPDADYQFKFIEEKTKKDKTDTQVLLLGCKKFIIVVFRGTEINRKHDIVTDIKYWHYENTDSGEVRYKSLPPGHGGFRRCVMNLMDYKNIFGELNAFVKKCGADKDNVPIYLTGHSLGSAIAQMFVVPLVKSNFKFSGMYNFAPPLAVHEDTAKEMRRNYENITYDIVNYKDFIARASGKSRRKLAHFGKFYRICDDGKIYKEEEKYVKFNLGEYSKEFELHKILNHIAAIKKTENSAYEINLRLTKHEDCIGETK